MTSADERSPTPVRRRPRQDRSAAKIEAILSATSRLLGRSEPSTLTVRTIATEAGVSAATVYRYFRDVDHVIDAVLVAHTDAATFAVTEALSASRHRTVAGVFQLVVDTHLRLYSARPDLTVTWASEDLARRRQEIEIGSDRSLALQVGRHLELKNLIGKMTSTEELLLNAHWATTGTLLGITLTADESDRPLLLDEIHRLVEHFASRYTPPPPTKAATCSPC